MVCFRDFKPLLAIVLVVPFALAPGACPVEVCDGQDNDGDGLIDEDFDLDGDGYFDTAECPTGLDCNDQDPAIHPNTAEPADGVDNDCDGKVDEDQSSYIIRFLAYYSEMPVSGVPVWLGTDGTGPVFHSDLNGEVVLYLEQQLQDWSYGYSHTSVSTGGTFYEYRRIYTYLSQQLEPETTFHVSAPELDNRERFQVTGDTSGIDPTLDSNAVWWTTNLGSRGVLPKEETMSHDVLAAVPGFLMAQQDACPYPEETDGPYSNMPLAYDLVLNPAETTDLSLEHTFDQTASFSLRNLDSRMTESVHDETINLRDELGTLYFYELPYPLNTPEAGGIATPALLGPLQGAEMILCPTVADDGEALSQWYCLNGSGRTTSYIADLPNIPTVAPYDPLTCSSVPGTTIDMSGDEDGSRDLVYFYSYVDYPDLERVVAHRWVVYQYDTTKAVTFSKIPEGACLWDEEPEGAAPGDGDTYLQYASASVRNDSSDDGVFAGSGAAVNLDVAVDGAGITRRVKHALARSVRAPDSSRFWPAPDPVLDP